MTISNESYRRPNISFTDILKKGAGGAYVERDEYSPAIFRALVLAVDQEGGKLESPDGIPHDGEKVEQIKDKNGKLIAQYTIKPTLGPYNPKGSIRARVLSYNLDIATHDQDLRTYWPMLQGTDNPSPGEVVYVMFEDSTRNHGLWLCKVPMPEENFSGRISNFFNGKNQILESEMTKSAANKGKVFLFNDGIQTPKEYIDFGLSDASPLSDLFAD